MAMAVAAVARTLQWKQVAILTSDDAYAGDLGRKIFAAREEERELKRWG